MTQRCGRFSPTKPTRYRQENFFRRGPLFVRKMARRENLRHSPADLCGSPVDESGRRLCVQQPAVDEGAAGSLHHVIAVDRSRGRRRRHEPQVDGSDNKNHNHGFSVDGGGPAILSQSSGVDESGWKRLLSIMLCLIGSCSALESGLKHRIKLRKNREDCA